MNDTHCSEASGDAAETESGSAQIEVRLFGVLGGLAPGGLLRLPVAEALSVAELRRRLAERLPDAAETLRRTAFASDERVLRDDEILRAPSTVAALPPVAGG